MHSPSRGRRSLRRKGSRVADLKRVEVWVLYGALAVAVVTGLFGLVHRSRILPRVAGALVLVFVVLALSPIT